jgi:hypothetical protein
MFPLIFKSKMLKFNDSSAALDSSDMDKENASTHTDPNTPTGMSVTGKGEFKG